MATDTTREAAAAAFVQKVQKMLDLKQADTRKVHTQTARKNHDQLLHWAVNMRQHEARIERVHERVYLVASDLRIKMQSHNSAGSDRWQRGVCEQRPDAFLNEKDLDKLHEKHWAIEIDGRYYELLRGVYGSRFSSANSAYYCNRRITARIFIGVTHYEHAALMEIGQGVIATQTRYELTRDNCHRFVRVFTALTLCPNHPADTLPNLPLNVEELIATNFLSQRDGCSGQARYHPPSFISSLLFSQEEDYKHRASRKVGEGVEWTLRREDFGTGLSLAIRRLKQVSESVGETTIYLDEFDVRQEQTSYLLEHDPALFSQCRTFYRSPYKSIVRFDKSTKYTIIPTRDKHNYIAGGPAWGMVAGPYGVTLSNGTYKHLRPVECIRDSYGIWRDGSGERLERPRSKLKDMFAKLHDSFLKQDRSDFGYKFPALQLFSLAVEKTFSKAAPLDTLAAIGVITTALAYAHAASKKPKELPARPDYESESETEWGPESRSPPRRYIR